MYVYTFLFFTNTYKEVVCIVHNIDDLTRVKATFLTKCYSNA